MNVIAEIQRINDLELAKGLTHTSGSWHTKYQNSAWVYAGNLPNNLSEGDVLCILSQYGEIDDIHLVRDSDSGKSKGFAFVKYEDARSCVLAVDNLTGSQVLGRTLRVDHVEKYRLPKHIREKNEKNELQCDPGGGAANGVADAGHAYQGQELASSYNIQAGQDLFAAPIDDRHKEEHVSEGAAGSDKEARKRRKELRAQQRREKEVRRQGKEKRKRRKRDQQESSHSKRN